MIGVINKINGIFYNKSQHEEYIQNDSTRYYLTILTRKEDVTWVFVYHLMLNFS